MSVSGWVSLLDVSLWSGGPTECPGVVRRPFRMSGSVREAHHDAREWSRG